MKKKIIKYLFLMAVIGFAGIACEGPTGPAGTQGTDGQDGAMGLIGPAGENGANMHAGEGAPDETLGEPGDLYLDLSTGNLYGPKSQLNGWGTPVNITGKDGEDGKDGADGKDGNDGADGKDGKDGNDGADGKDGKDGNDGADGKHGNDGADGSKIFAGDGAPSAGLGNNGDFYLDKINFLLYGPKTNNDWGTPINLQGPIGPQGPQGPPGQDGADGQDGKDGQDGEDGNSAILLYEFGEHFFSTALNLQLEISRETVDNSLLLVYYNPSSESETIWYPIPGMGPVAAYNTRYAIFQSNSNPSIYTLAIRIANFDGSNYINSVRFRKIKVIFAEASSIFAGKINFDDYHAVMEYYGLEP